MEACLVELYAERDIRVENLREAMPLKIEFVNKTKPDKLYKKDFLKKMRTVEFKEITKVEQHKSIIEKEYIIIYVKGEKPIKIDRYNENVEVLLMRLKDEKISVM